MLQEGQQGQTDEAIPTQKEQTNEAAQTQETQSDADTDEDDNGKVVPGCLTKYTHLGLTYPS